MKFQLPYEILKLKDEPLKEGEVNYARFIQDNLDAIERYLNKKVLGEEWTDWTPTYDASGNMTFTNVTTNYARYCIIDKVLFFMINAYGTTGGTADTILRFTIPKNPVEVTAGGCFIIEYADSLSGTWWYAGSSKIGVRKYDESNWGLGTSRGFHVQGFYRIT